MFLLTRDYRHSNTTEEELKIAISYEINEDYKKELLAHTAHMRNTILSLFSLPCMIGIPLIIIVNDAHHRIGMETSDQERNLKQAQQKQHQQRTSEARYTNHPSHQHHKRSSPPPFVAGVNGLLDKDEEDNLDACMFIMDDYKDQELSMDECKLCRYLVNYASQLVCSQSDFEKYLDLSGIQRMLYGGIDLQGPMRREYALNYDNTNDIFWSNKGVTMGKSASKGVLDRVSLLFLPLGDESNNSEIQKTVMNIRYLESRKRKGREAFEAKQKQLRTMRREKRETDRARARTHSSRTQLAHHRHTKKKKSLPNNNSSESNELSEGDEEEDDDNTGTSEEERSSSSSSSSYESGTDRSWRNLRGLALLWDWIVETGDLYEKTLEGGSYV